MFDGGTSWLLLLLTSPGVFYTQFTGILPPVLEACFHALLYSMLQAPSISIQWGELSQTAKHWEYALWLLPMLAIAVQWMGRLPETLPLPKAFAKSV